MAVGPWVIIFIQWEAARARQNTKPWRDDSPVFAAITAIHDRIC
jgi:hypothetical protein